VPVLVAGRTVARDLDIGTRESFADLGQTVAAILDVGPLPNGTSFLDEILR
jgi:phosphopentomutase